MSAKERYDREQEAKKMKRLDQFGASVPSVKRDEK